MNQHHANAQRRNAHAEVAPTLKFPLKYDEKPEREKLDSFGILSRGWLSEGTEQSEQAVLSPRQKKIDLFIFSRLAPPNYPPATTTPITNVPQRPHMSRSVTVTCSTG